MGKKEKNKKKGKGAEKTIEKTQKKLKSKVLKATGEDDIESIVKAIEEEEKKRKEVKEAKPYATCPICHQFKSNNLYILGRHQKSCEKKMEAKQQQVRNFASKI